MRGRRWYAIAASALPATLMLGACSTTSGPTAPSPGAGSDAPASTPDEPFLTWQQERVMSGDEDAVAVATHAHEHVAGAAARASGGVSGTLRVRLLAVAVDGDLATSTVCRDLSDQRGPMAGARTDDVQVGALRLRRDAAAPAGWAVVGPAAAIAAPAACVRALRRDAPVEVVGPPDQPSAA